MRSEILRSSLALGVALAALLPLSLPAQAQAGCQFVLGFAALRAQVGTARVGACRESEWHNPTSGDTIQHTTGGLLVWRKADNWTAFTDGYRTWVDGPHSVQVRLNTQRFPWEADYARYAPAPTSVRGPAQAGSNPTIYVDVPRVSMPPRVDIPPVYNYIPPVYNPPVFNYTPPIYNPPPVYSYNPPIYTPPVYNYTPPASFPWR